MAARYLVNPSSSAESKYHCTNGTLSCKPRLRPLISRFFTALRKADLVAGLDQASRVALDSEAETQAVLHVRIGTAIHCSPGAGNVGVPHCRDWKHCC